VDVPPKLSAQVRVFATGNGRKTDQVDAHSVALAALRGPGLVQVQVEEDLVVLGCWPIAGMSWAGPAPR
jgi:transposase